ncbi:glycoside hydrolase family 71/99-like protein [Tundrisphaera sp. TA3]|uniref:glycoside hydrolase family 71/99-like protein n=1 Tax=Tundrisphaera sp. TA3 TaxID=3435775 RepID=UPI003EBF8D1E
MTRRSSQILPGVIAVLSAIAPAPARVDAADRVDATTMHRKLMCGYQGWFRCPGDPADEGWVHWSRDTRAISPRSLTFEMWPDTSELTPEERYPAPGFTHPDGTPAVLFSSANAKTVGRHFRWMEEHEIDGVFLQRFLVDLRRASTNLVLGHVRASAAETGRAYAIGYDLSGERPGRIVDRLTGDWKALTEELKVTGDDRYLQHEGKPVVFVWGFFPDRFEAGIAHQILDLFRADGPSPAFVIGGCPWDWRRAKDPEWARAFRRFGAISPWNVGNVSIEAGIKHAATRTWKDDQAEATRTGMAFLPVIYPGFAWTHLKGEAAAGQTIPRRDGAFFREQFDAAFDLGVDMAYVAMFDEVDEGTAIFKVSPSPPREGRFATFGDLPVDAYLRMTGEASRRLKARP